MWKCENYKIWKSQHLQMWKCEIYKMWKFEKWNKKMGKWKKCDNVKITMWKISYTKYENVIFLKRWKCDIVIMWKCENWEWNHKLLNCDHFTDNVHSVRLLTVKSICTFLLIPFKVNIGKCWKCSLQVKTD